ncbi:MULTISPECIES: (2Fe-2S)-binding protein [unclassified Leisingera]|uniref:(2Fe-2S)-binding protein n=1 Tax=unclassified Leisingera TaxID=2614906 RepID=UPI000310CE6A|nr:MULTISPECIES: (2Fe-2S)-binding protein [unclassified Leisingera]KIC17440.1 NAD(FAD)-dependent dehydrogenase [Leisingera sp. ANG-DT]KIC22941.1 NAD(FAD)-dependent dehydrogenase [Leisingera sp. ANG-S3]KIC27127.1 NAD(FAD)-dependent dehydrogenase [Leisingera sp. ANG-M6]KIC52234.1 NAD(FAD)-dependent dehydrogenase [Leisingera sp. ANG-S]KID09792.1 NAD(FAD)-dependent dehydrogenase [Leisingera sp. ANG1]
MKTDSPFLELAGDAPRVRVWFDGLALDLPAGANLAAALLAVGVQVFRHTPVSGAPRAPFCMMGACFECLVETGGRVQQACMLEVEEGMQIARPHEAEANDAML